MVDVIDVPEEYTLDDLLSDGDQEPSVTVTINKKEKKFWVRPPNDSEKAMAQNAARQHSRKLREVLEDTETEEHQLLVKAEIENMTVEDIRLVWLSANLFQRIFEDQRRSLDNRDEFFVPAPQGKEDGIIPPTAADMDAYEIAKRKGEAERLQILQDQRTALYNEVKAEADSLEEGTLKAMIAPLIIDQQTSKEWNAYYGLQVVMRCTYEDPEFTERSFKTTEQVMRLQTSKNGQHVLESLLAAHSGLMLDPDRIKN